MARDVAFLEQRLSDLVFRPEPRDDGARDEAAPQTLREALARLRAQARPAPRVVPAARRRDGSS
jgi:hypothetical protein